MKYLNPKPIKVILQNIAGEEKEFVINSLPPDLLQRVYECEKLVDQLMVLFGTKEDWNRYDVRVLRPAVEQILNEAQNPS